MHRKRKWNKLFKLIKQIQYIFFIPFIIIISIRICNKNKKYSRILSCIFLTVGAARSIYGKRYNIITFRCEHWNLGIINILAYTYIGKTVYTYMCNICKYCTHIIYAFTRFLPENLCQTLWGFSYRNHHHLLAKCAQCSGSPCMKMGSH